MARKKLTPAELKANRVLAHDIVGYDATTAKHIYGKSKIEILDLIDTLADAGDTTTIKEVTAEFKKRLVQGQLTYGVKR